MAGYRITPAAVTVFSGRPVEQRDVYRTADPDETRFSSVADTAQPLSVLGRDFPLEGSLHRAVTLVEGCDGEAHVQDADWTPLASATVDS